MPNAASYTVPDNPADPEAAALDLIERRPADILHTGAFTEVLQDYCSVPHADGAFAGLEWADARQKRSRGTSSAAMSAADFLRNRARNVLADVDGMVWQNREAAARALNIAATVLGL